MRKTKRQRFLTIILFPLVVPIWVIGWILFFFGQSKPKPKKPVKPTPPKLLLLEEPIEA